MTETHTPTRQPGPVRGAVVIVLLEALALTGATVFLLADTAFGTPSDLARALVTAVLAAAGAALLVLAARGLWHLRPAARTPVVVLQILALPVAYSLAFQAHRVAYGGPILVAALAVLYLLFTPPARAALDRPYD